MGLWQGLDLTLLTWENDNAAEIKRIGADEYNALVGQECAQMLNREIDGTKRSGEFDVFSAKALSEMSLPPIQYIVPGLIPAGLGLLVADPKTGKSWMALDLVLSVASGRSFLGYSVNQSGALYLALEDSKARIKSRQKMVLNGDDVPENVFFSIQAPRLDEGLLDWLESFSREKEGVRLIVIDTLAIVKPQSKTAANVYDAEYRFMNEMKSFADSHSVCILLVHHTNKGFRDTTFGRISGSNAIMGGSDFSIVLTKDNGNDGQVTFNLTGRDVEAQELILSFDAATHRWQRQGTVAEVIERRQIEEYDQNPIVITLREILQQGDGEWTGSSKQLNELIGRYSGESLNMSSQGLAKAILELEPLLKERDCIQHTEKSNGSGGKRHTFRMNRTDNNENSGNFDQLVYT